MEFILFIASIVVLIVWIAVIVAVFQMRTLLQTLIVHAEATNRYLRDIRDSVYQEAAAPPEPGAIKPGG